MRVLFVIDTWGLIGGTERHAQVVVPALLERGHQVTILCREDQQPGFAAVDVIELPALDGTWLARPDRRELGARVRAAAPDVVFLSALRNVDAVEDLTDLAPVVRYVHDHTLFCPGLNKYTEDGETCRDAMGLVCLQRYWLGSGCICFKKERHKNPLADPLRELRAKQRELAIAQASSRVLTNSNYMRNELLKVGFHPDTTSVLYIFTESNTTKQPAGPLPGDVERFLAQDDAPVIFTPARLTLPDKGVDYLLTMLADVDAPFRCVIAGSGPAEDWLREKAELDGVADRVHFAGWQASPTIEALYDRADVVVCPSVWDEPFGLVGIEAMAHAKPVVAFGVGGIPEWLVHEKSGFLIEPRDTWAMAKAVERLVTEEALRERMGAYGRESVKQRFPREGHLAELERHLLAAAGELLAAG